MLRNLIGTIPLATLMVIALLLQTVNSHGTCCTTAPISVDISMKRIVYIYIFLQHGETVCYDIIMQIIKVLTIYETFKNFEEEKRKKKARKLWLICRHIFHLVQPSAVVRVSHSFLTVCIFFWCLISPSVFSSSPDLEFLR